MNEKMRQIDRAREELIFICGLYNLNYKEIISEVTYPKSDRRFAKIVEARKRIAWRLKFLGFSYPVIGNVLNKDHSTIIYYLNDLEKRDASLKKDRLGGKLLD